MKSIHTSCILNFNHLFNLLKWKTTVLFQCFTPKANSDHFYVAKEPFLVSEPVMKL